jgi:hypothetical protein
MIGRLYPMDSIRAGLDRVPAPLPAADVTKCRGDHSAGLSGERTVPACGYVAGR